MVTELLSYLVLSIGVESGWSLAVTCVTPNVTVELIGIYPAAAAVALPVPQSVETKQWWKKQSELWVDVHTEEQFLHEINTGSKLVFVGAQPEQVLATCRSSCVSHCPAEVKMQLRCVARAVLPGSCCRKPDMRPSCQEISSEQVDELHVCMQTSLATWCNGCQRSYPELCKLAMDPDMNKALQVCQGNLGCGSKQLFSAAAGWCMLHYIAEGLPARAGTPDHN